MSPQGIRVWVVAPVVLLAALAQAAPCVEVPVLFIVQDKSLSMVKAPDGSEPTVSVPSKWQSAATVVPSLAQQFENRFKFGVQMYPQGGSADTQCLPMAGGPVALVPSTAAVVRSTYAAAVPAGGTPTAVSLRAAKTYLQALATTSVKNVLLITDGMPNCNFGLDTANCQSTSPGVICPSPSCGSNICLDDANTAAAAGELRAIGIKVFVVGFGTSLTGGNNKAVLDAIAAAGGTSSSYSASNEATLAAALNSIAASTSTCCQDACTQGAKQCSGTGTLQSCQMDLNVGCTNWVSAACPTLTVCQSGACQPCVNPCTPGALRCTGTTAEQCVAVTGGCPKWTTADVCTSGEVCKAGVCTSCRDCTLGAARCVGTGVEECKATAVPGCSGWQLRACVSGSICQSGLCASCNQVCTAGSKRCNGKSVETCIADASGCTQWQQSLACGANSFCSGGQCGQCGPACAAGATRCNGNGTETCATDANGCPTWGGTTPCQSDEFCGAAGQCQACSSRCARGAKRCGANGLIEECGVETTGCSVWTASGQCDVSAGERCENGFCIPPCRDACVEKSARCTGTGAPELCARQADGCTQWAPGASCATGTQCVEGACRGPCANDEFASCPTGLACSAVPNAGALCMPDGADGGAGTGGGMGSGGGAGGGSGSGGGGGGLGDGGSATGRADGGPAARTSSASSAAAMGCSCAMVDGGSLAGLALGLALLLRRRKS